MYTKQRTKIETDEKNFKFQDPINNWRLDLTLFVLKIKKQMMTNSETITVNIECSNKSRKKLIIYL